MDYTGPMLDFAVLVTGAALPAGILIAWFYRMDRARPEPVGLLGRSVLYGFLATVPAAALEFVVQLPARVMPGIMAAAWTAFATAALVEEGVKYFFLKRALYRQAAFDEVLDGIVYAVCVSLGFAFAENLMYGMGGGWVLFVRAFTAVPMHAVATGIMGYWLGVSKFERDPALATADRKRGFLYALAIHGLYDFLLFTRSAFSVLSIVVLVAGALHLSRLVKKAKAADDMVATLKAGGTGPAEVEPPPDSRLDIPEPRFGDQSE